MTKPTVVIYLACCLFLGWQTVDADGVYKRVPANSALEVARSVLKVPGDYPVFNPPVNGLTLPMEGGVSVVRFGVDGRGALLNTALPPAAQVVASFTWSAQAVDVFLCSSTTCCERFQMTASTGDDGLRLRVQDRDPAPCHRLIVQDELTLVRPFGPSAVPSMNFLPTTPDAANATGATAGNVTKATNATSPAGSTNRVTGDAVLLTCGLGASLVALGILIGSM